MNNIVITVNQYLNYQYLAFRAFASLLNNLYGLCLDVNHKLKPRPSASALTSITVSESRPSASTCNIMINVSASSIKNIFATVVQLQIIYLQLQWNVISCEYASLTGAGRTPLPQYTVMTAVSQY